MVGTTISSQHRLPWFRTLASLTAVACLVAAVATGDLNYAITAILPILIAASLWLTRPARFHCAVKDIGLELHEPQRENIAYHEIIAVNVWGLPYPPDSEHIPDGPVTIVHRRGVAQIPEQLSVRAGELVRFLAGKFIPPWNRNVHPILQSYLSAQESKYGAEQVWTFATRTHLGRAVRNPRPLAVSASVVLAGVIWILVGRLLGGIYEGWLGGGFMLTLLAGMFTLLFAISYFSGRSIAPKEEHSVVVSPEGMALVQGATRGQMRWDELQSVKLRFKAKGLVVDGSQAKPGIVLSFPGAAITIPDVYDHPLYFIEFIIRRYWHGE